MNTQIFAYRRCGDIVGETFLSSIDSPNLMIITMDTKLAGGRVTKKGFKLHVEKEREGNCVNIIFSVSQFIQEYPFLDIHKKEVFKDRKLKL